MAESSNDRTAALTGQQMDALAGVVTAYVGPNAAHRELRTALANAKAIAFILIEGDAKVLKAFLQHAEEIKRQAKGADFAFEVGGRATKTTLQLAGHLTGAEIDLIAGASGGFISLALGLVYREVYRAFETYLVALFQEIGFRDKRVLFSNRTLSHEDALRPSSQEELQRFIIEKRKMELSRGGLKDFEKLFEDLGIPIVPMVEPPPLAQQESVLARLRAASVIRDVIEHNNGMVHAEFLKAVSATSLIGLPNVQGPRHYFLKAETGRFNLEGFPTSFSIGDGADKHSAGPHEHTEQNTDVSVALTGEGMASLTGHLKTI